MIGLARLAAPACGLALAAASAAPAEAQFYTGKTVTTVVNYGAGGNADIQARIFVKYLPKYIKGSPVFIIQNSPGAGGMTAMNLLGQKVGGLKNDGMSLGYFTFNGMAPLIGDPALKVTMSDFDFIAGVGGWNVAYARKEVLKDPAKPASIAGAKAIFAGGYSPQSSHDTRIRMSLDMMKADYKIVTGFPDASAVNKAIIQGELNMSVSSLPGWASIVIPQLIQPGLAVALWQYPVSGPNGTYVGNPSLAKLGIRPFTEVYKEAYGKYPEGPLFDAFILVNNLSTKVERIVVMPAGSPKAAVAEMQHAFAATGEDKEFIAEWERIIKDPPELTSPKEGEELFASLAHVKPEVKATLKKAAGVE
jgi:tripartite-type tricarboxylate transporter receptor subunit TctC